MKMLNFRDGKALIGLARKTVENSLKNRKFKLAAIEGKSLQRKAGVFVTINTYPERMLRGCIGFISALPLYEAVQRAAHAAAFEDPRFPPIAEDELEKIVFEISVLTEPKELRCKPSEYASNIEIGSDGLIVQCGPSSGLLLPQVAVEQDWTAEEFLDQVCFKAGLTPDYLHDRSTRLWKFQAQIFAEKEPSGEIEEVKIHSPTS